MPNEVFGTLTSKCSMNRLSPIVSNGENDFVGYVSIAHGVKLSLLRMEQGADRGGVEQVEGLQW